MSPVAYNFISSPQSPSTLIKNMVVGMSHSDRGEDRVPLRFKQIRECGMPLSGSEGETAEIRSTLTPTLSRQREREIII